MIEDTVNSVKDSSKPIEYDRRFFLKYTLTVLAIPSFVSPLFAESAHKYNSKYHTIAHDALDLEKDFGVVNADYQLLDNIIDEAEERIELKSKYSKNATIKILKTIDSILKEQGFKYERHGLLNHGLKTKKIDCDNYSLIYLAIAETLNLPIVGVNAPEHVFVRWDSDGKHDAIDPSNPVNKFDFNWETTEAKIRTDDFYKSWLNIADKSIAADVFLKNLNRNETLAILYDNRGVAWYKKGDFDKAMEDYTKSINLNPKYYESFYNKGVVWEKKGNPDKAIEYYTKSVNLNPNYFKAYFNMGNIWFKKGNLDKAIENYTQAINSNKKYFKAHNNRGVAWYEKGDFDKAIEDYTQAINLNPKYSEAFYNRGLAWKKKGNFIEAEKDFSIARRLNE